MSLNEKYLPKKDVVFTAMFLNKELCEELLNVVLDEKVELIDILSECENNFKKAALNSIYFDIKTRTTDNRIITLDLQRIYNEKRIPSRVIYYACREIGNQKIINSKYEELNSVIVTFILTEAQIKHTRKNKKIQLKVEETGEVYSDLLTLHEISLRCIDKNDSIEMQIIRDFFDIINEVEYNKFINTYDEKLAKLLVNEYEKVTNEENLKDILEIEKEDKYMIRLIEEDRMQERQEGKEEGRQEGREEGIEEGIEKGIEKGIQQGIEKSINVLIDTFRELNLAENDIVNKLTAKFSLTPEQVNKYLK